MKQKLFFIATLILSSFAFISCDEVLDNPAINSEASSQQWNYEVSVKFADFDFTGVPGGPYAYKAPQKLYVYNEAGIELGTLTTADEMDDLTKFYKFAGTLEGTFGENLIIATANAEDFAKQDGTLATIIDNSLILQTAIVPVRNYSTAGSVVFTANATLENKVGLIQLSLGGNAASTDKKVTFSAEDLFIPGATEKEFTITLAETVNPKTTFYVVAGTEATDPIDVNIAVDAAERGVQLKAKVGNISIANGVYTPFGSVPMKYASVDLTKFWAAYKEANPTATSATLNPSDGTIITQTSSENVPVRIYNYSAKELTLKNVNAEYLYINVDNSCKVTLEGKNTINYETGWAGTRIENSIVTFTGSGSFDTTGKNYGAAINGSYIDAESVTQYSTLIIDKEIKFNASATQNRGIYVLSNAILEVKDDATLTATGPDGGFEFSTNSTFDIGKATIEATGTGDNSIGIQTNSGTITVGEGAIITAKAGKNGEGINSGASWDIKKGAKIYAYGGKDGKGIDWWKSGSSTITIGEDAVIEAYGAPTINDDALGQGMRLGVDVTISKGATIKATGADRYGLYIYGTTTLDIAEGATIEAIDALGNAMEIEDYGAVTIKGKGNLNANEAGKHGIEIHAATLTLDGAEVTAKGGAGKPAIIATGNLAVTSNLVKLTATAGEGSTICISKSDAEAAKADIGTADTDKFNDAIAAGVRTITPKAAAE